MQYFLGYNSFTNEDPFSDTLFVEIMKRLRLESLSKINEVMAQRALKILMSRTKQPDEKGDQKRNSSDAPAE